MPTKANKATNHSCTSDSSHTNELNQKTKNSKKKVGKNLASVLKGIPEEEIKNSTRSLRTRKKEINYDTDNDDDDIEGSLTHYKTKNEDSVSYESDFELNKKRKREKIRLTKTKPHKKEIASKPCKKKLNNINDYEAKRNEQIESLLNWKKNTANAPKSKDEYSYIESKEITSISNVKSFLSLSDKQLHSIFISPPWNNNSYTFNTFKQLNIPIDAMENGLLFIWTKKEYLCDMIDYIESLEENNTIKYVENLVWVKLEKNIETNTNKENPFNINDIFHKGNSEYFTNSHMTLLMFKKEKNPDVKIELRHQRTSDVVFDIYDKETNINYSPNEFIYKMIEILLPKANILEAPKGTLKMLEIYAMKNSNRRGWIHLSEEY